MKGFYDKKNFDDAKAKDLKKSTTSQANEEFAESDAQESYDKQTQENKIQKTMKELGIKYQTQEFKGLDGEIAELTSDHRTVGTEHDAVLEYYAKIKGRCIAKDDHR